MGVKTSNTNTKTCTFRALCAHTNDIVYLTIILHKKKSVQRANHWAL
jgi:hypothetical protein